MANDLLKSSQAIQVKTRIESESNLINYHMKTLNKMVFLLIENDYLFPSWSSMINQQSFNGSDMVNSVDYKLLMQNEDNKIGENDVNSNKNRTCAQIFGLIQPILNKTSVNTKNPLILQRQSLLNLTLEIKMPQNFYSLLYKIESKLVSQLTMNATLNGKKSSNISLVPLLKETNFDLNISDSFFNFKIFSKLFWKNYELFHFNIVYFSAIASSLLLFVSILVYSIFHNRLMMPRSFFHVYINIWLCVLLLIVFFTFGIYQVNLPYLCLSTAILLHYLTLCASVWYTLYFYCLYQKLQTLKKRNFNLIFNKEAAMNNFGKNDFAPNHIGSQEYVKKSVIHLYMLGWGMPSLLCSIIVSITKRDYIQVPFGYCFTNEQHILIGSVFVPILILFVIKMVLVVLIWITLRRILIDLKGDKEDESENSDENENQKSGMTVEELNDKVELCKKWAQTKPSGSINGKFFIKIFLLKKSSFRIQK